MTTVSRLQDELRASKEELSKVADQIKQLGCIKRALEKKVKDIKSELNLLNERESSVTKYDHDDFPWYKEMMSKLRTIFKIEDFRSHQKSAINATMLGVDLLLVMPTGGGKSLCFQLPAVLSAGVTVVVSPLISLMVDQLQGLQLLGVHTEIFNGQSDRQDTKRIFAAMSDPKSELKMLYVTPEKLAKSKRLMSQLEKMYRYEKQFTSDVYAQFLHVFGNLEIFIRVAYLGLGGSQGLLLTKFIVVHNGVMISGRFILLYFY